MLEKTEGSRYIYKRKDGLEFTLKRYNGVTWETLQVGDYVRMSATDFKIIDITPTTVLVEEIIQEEKRDIK
jgi:hypothetical protein